MKCLAPNVPYFGNDNILEEDSSESVKDHSLQPLLQPEILLLHSHIPKFPTPFSELSDIGINITLRSSWNTHKLTYILSVENCPVSKTILPLSP